MHTTSNILMESDEKTSCWTCHTDTSAIFSIRCHSQWLQVHLCVKECWVEFKVSFVNCLSLLSCSQFSILPGGAGGKGVWGTPGQVYDVEEVDIKDPNYDDDQVGKQTSLLSACFDFILIKITVMLILINVQPHKLYGCLTSCIKCSLFLV